MIVYIERIPADGLDIEDAVSADALGLAESQDGSVVVGDVRLRLNLNVVGGELLVRGSWSGEIELVCSRCLEVFRVSLDEKELFWDFEIMGRDSIDLTDRVREDIILHFPVKPLCRAECRGLCPRCGANLEKGEDCGCPKTSVDPRLAGLDRFRKKTE